MSTIFNKFVAALLVVALGATACSSASDSPTNWVEEVAKAGFTDPVLTESGGNRVVVIATAGYCRLRFIADVKTSRLYATVPNAPLEEDGSYFGDPSLALLKEDERFSACFSDSEGKQS